MFRFFVFTLPPDLFSAWTQTKEKDSKSVHRARLRQATQDSIRLLENIDFLISVLIENEKHREVAFQLGLFSLALRRPPSATKAAEVKLFYIQNRIVDRIKKVKFLESDFLLSEIRKHASRIIAADEDGWIGRDLLWRFNF